MGLFITPYGTLSPFGSGDGTVYDYYVATTGSDTNPGTATEPFLTIGKANTVVADGERVWVEIGTYSAPDIVFSKGYWYTNGATINLNGADTYTTQLSGTDKKYFNGFTFDGTDSTAAVLYLQGGSSNAEFVNCSVTNAPTYTITPANTCTDGFIFTGCNMECGSSGFMLSYATGMLFDNCTFPDIQGNGFYRVTVAGNLTIRNSSITMAGGKLCWLRANGTYTFDNNTITTSANITTLTDVHSGATGSNLVFTNNITTTAHVSAAAFITLQNNIVNDVTITGNTMTFTNGLFDEHVISATYTGDAVISNNTIENQANKAVNIAQIYAHSTTLGSLCTINDNILKSRNESGYQISVGTENTSADDDKIVIEIKRNTFYGAYYYDDTSTGIVHTIHVGFNKDFTIQDNIIYGGGYGLALENDGATATGGAISGNEFYDCKTNRINGISGVEITNNIFSTSKSYCDNLLSVSTQTNPSLNTNFHANTLIESGTSSMAAWLLFADDNTPDVIDYDTITGTPIYSIESSVLTGFVAIQAASWELNGTNP